MPETSVLAMPSASRQHEIGCAGPVSCDFTTAKVRVYLICWNQAIRFHEPFEYVYAAVRHSRSQGSRTGDDRADALRGVDIRIALEQAAAAGYQLASWNAEPIAAWLCGNQHQEPAVDEADFEALR